MDTSNRNTVWASAIAEELSRAGVRVACISPGSRSTPLALALHAHPAIETIVHVDERSGGFFALGVAKRSHTPVALLCTSGTAAANYFPAAIEAFYSGVSLVILTADRPPELRDCGAGQAIDQLKLYGGCVRWFFELGTPEISAEKLRFLRATIGRAVATAAGAGETPPGPIHLNVPFADPLVPEKVSGDIPLHLPETAGTAWWGRDRGLAYSQAIAGQVVLDANVLAVLANQILSHPRGAIAVGVWDAPPGFGAAVDRLARATGYPLLAEPPGLARMGWALGYYDGFLRSPAFRATHLPELLLRFGALPTAKSLRQWLEAAPDCQHIVVGNGNYSNPAHAPIQIVRADPVAFCDQLARYLELYALPGWQDKEWRFGFERAEMAAARAIAEVMGATEDLFEAKIYAELGQWLPESVLLYVASSMPIRDLEAFFRSPHPIGVLSNRGANGIDGTLSSALGAAWRSDRPVVLICGDLAFYHDLNGLLAAKRYAIDLTVVLIDNNGGGIFELLPIAQYDVPFEELFATPHNLDFAPIVRAYGCDYIPVRDWGHFRTAVLDSLQQPGTQVICISCDRQQDKQRRAELWQHVVAAVERSMA